MKRSETLADGKATLGRDGCRWRKWEERKAPAEGGPWRERASSTGRPFRGTASGVWRWLPPCSDRQLAAFWILYAHATSWRIGADKLNGGRLGALDSDAVRK